MSVMRGQSFIRYFGTAADIAAMRAQLVLMDKHLADILVQITK